MALNHGIFKDIKMFIFDVDGVFTDTTVLIADDGRLLRTMTVRDGSAIKKALDAGYLITVITKGASVGVKQRLLALGILEVFDKVDDKLPVYKTILEKYSVTSDQCLYMGDDNADMVVLREVGLPTCPADAIPDVQELSAYISPLGGGRGCVRDVIERTMRIQGTWVSM